MLKKQIAKKRHSERGMAMAIAIVTLLIITSVVAVMILSSSTESAISGNFKDEQTAFYAARGGVEEVRDRLRTLPGPPTGSSLSANLPTALPGAAGGVLYVLNPLNSETDTPWDSSSSGKYFDSQLVKEVGSQPSATGWYATANANSAYQTTPQLPWKWVRITAKTNSNITVNGAGNNVDGQGGGTFVDGSGTGTVGQRICWDGQSQFATTQSNCQNAGGAAQVYKLTALAVTPSGSRRMIQYEVTTNVVLPLVAAMYAKGAVNTGQALNVTGNTDSSCASPSTYGAASGTSTVTEPGGGNVTGSPAALANNYGWNVNLTGLESSLSAGAVNISTVSGTTTSGSNVTLHNGTLGTAPTVTYNGSDNLATITNAGNPVTYVTPDLTNGSTNPSSMGTLTLGGTSPGISGQGVLLVRGNLTIDFGSNFDYFGLIVVLGNINMVNTGNGNANPHIHGAILAGGTILANGTGMGNFGGSISIHQNSCMVNNAITSRFFRTLAQRELIY